MRGRTLRCASGLLVSGVFASATTLVSPASAAAATLTAEADAFVLNNQPNANRGSIKLLRVRNDVKYSYLRFQVPELPAGELVSTATLSLYASSPSRCSLGVDVLRAASDSWGETTINWTNQPGPTGAVLANASWTTSGYRSFDVTTAIEGSGPVSFTLRHAIGCVAPSDTTFHSREGVNRPQLVVETGGGPSAVCDDGADNDGDTLIDFPADPGCSDALDTDETDPPELGVEPVQPWLETQPVDGQNDVADDAAIWVHPTDLSKTIVLGTDKNDTGVGGLHVFDLSGQSLSKAAHGTRINGVDVRDGFPLGFESVPLVSVTNQDTNGLDFFRIDPATLTLTKVGAVTSAVAGAAGVCMFHSPTSGEFFTIVTHSGNGTLEQFRLDGSSGTVVAELVRTFEARSTAEGCVADDALRHLYVAQETKGIWRYAAEPSGGSARTLVDDDSATGHLVADIEGLAIWQGPSGTGWLIASSQGESTFAVYSRQPPNAYQGEFDVTAVAGIDDTNETDGIEVTSTALPAPFASGLFVAHDHSSEGPFASNFKYVRWEDIASALGL